MQKESQYLANVKTSQTTEKGFKQEILRKVGSWGGSPRFTTLEQTILQSSPAPTHVWALPTQLPTRLGSCPSRISWHFPQSSSTPVRSSH